MKITVRPGSVSEVVELSKEIPELDNPYDEIEYYERLKGDYQVLVADVMGVPVGFKVGYDRYQDGKTFYSWMGGVHPSHRKMGVARLLSEKMEVWCRLKGYKRLRFKALNTHRAMMHFAIDQGFNVVGFTEHPDPGLSEIFFEKDL